MTASSRIAAIFFFLLMAAAPLLAQKKSMHGVVSDKSSNQPISMAGIRNVNNGNTAITHRDGSFIVDASAGAVIAVTANGYYSDTLSVGDSLFAGGVLRIALKPIPSTLQDVTITSNYNPYQLDSLARRRYFLQTVGDHKISTISRPNDSKDFGVALNLDHFSKKEKDKRYARSLFDIMEEEAYINYRWNERLVTKYTQYRDDELAGFMQKTRPAYDWLRGHETEEDMLYYINSQLKKYRKDLKMP